MSYTLSNLTDPTEPFIFKRQKIKLENMRLKCLDNAPSLRALVQTPDSGRGAQRFPAPIDTTEAALKSVGSNLF